MFCCSWITRCLLLIIFLLFLFSYRDMNTLTPRWHPTGQMFTLWEWTRTCNTHCSHMLPILCSWLRPHPCNLIVRVSICVLLCVCACALFAYAADTLQLIKTTPLQFNGKGVYSCVVVCACAFFEFAANTLLLKDHMWVREYVRVWACVNWRIFHVIAVSTANGLVALQGGQLIGVGALPSGTIDGVR